MSHLDHFLDEHVKRAGHCPLCKAKYAPLEASVIASGESDANLVHVECPRCHGAVVAIVSASRAGMTSMGVVTDLSSDDLERICNDACVTSDDVLENYSFLSAENGRQLIDALTDPSS